MEVLQVSSRRDIKKFIRLPVSIYADDPLWVPPMWKDEVSAYTPRGNPILARSPHALLIVRRGNMVVGRCVVYIDNDYNTYFACRTGLFGSYECSDDPEAASALILAAEEWSKERGMDQILGPFHPVAECWGFLNDNDGRPPIFMTPYNPDYYLSHFEAMGYSTAKNLLAYDVNADGNYSIPERFSRFTETLLKNNPEISLRPISGKNLIQDAEHIWRLSNLSFSGNWGYVPVEREIMLDMVRRLKPVMDPDAIWFVEHRGEPVGFCLGFPDVNRALKATNGKLFPLGFLRLLSIRRWIRDYRLFGLAVHPDYHGRGFDVLLYSSLFHHLKPRNIRLEANYILEDNASIRNALEKLGMNLIKSYRIYKKELV